MPVLITIDNPRIASQRRMVTSIGKKRDVLQVYADAGVDGTPPCERKEKRRALSEREGIDHTIISRWRRNCQKVEKVGGRRLSRRRIRCKGAGRPTTMGHEQEMELDAWVEQRRRCPEHYGVSEEEIRRQIKRMFSLEVGEHCVRGFMKRWRWTVRLRTITKQVTGEEAQLTKEPFQAFFAAMFYTKHPCLIYNCDESSVYLDAPRSRTVERVGAEVVEIGTGGHELDRVMIMLFVSRSGVMGTPLVIHPNSRKGGHKPIELITVQGERGPFEM